jgi:hypothetical protein
MKIEKHFAILEDGQETVAEILTTFVYKEDIYIALHIASTDAIKLYQVLPRGLKDAPKPVLRDFLDYTASQSIKPKLKKKWSRNA